MRKIKLNEDAIRQIAEEHAAGNPQPLMLLWGVTEAKGGGFNATISDGHFLRIFTEPVLKTELEAEEYAKWEITKIESEVVELAQKLGYELKLDGRIWGTTND